MAKKIKLELTEHQFNCIMEICADVESMIGCADDCDDGFNWDIQTKKRLKSISLMLNKNGIKSPLNN